MEFDFSGNEDTYFSLTTPNNAVYIDKITIEYEAGESNAATAPTLTTTGVFTTSTYDVTITNKESGATVYFTTDGTNPTTSSSSFTGDSKTITIDATTTVKAMAVISGKDNSAVASATYTYEEPVANTAETAYTTAEAIALIDAGNSQLATTEVYVKGTISKVDSYNSTYGSITYWLDDDAFEVYSGLGIDGAQFTAATDLQAGDEVVVKGLITKYNTTYEFSKNNVLVSRETTATQTSPTFTLGTYKTSMTVGDDADSYAITTNSDGALSATSSAESVATVNVEGTTVTVTAVAAGTATITIAAEATNTYYAASKAYTLTVTEPLEPAALPFAFDSGVSAIATTTGMSQTGIGSDYTASPKLKFDTTGDNLIIYFEKADNATLSYSIKGNSVSGSCSFDVQESANGTDYTTVKNYTALGTTATQESLSLDASTCYVKFVYTNKDKGNVALGNIQIINGQFLTIGSTKYATYYNSANAYTMPADCEGAVFTAADKLTTVYNAGEVVPAGEPLVISTTASGIKALNFASSTEQTYKSQGLNDLEGTDEETALTADDDYYFYGLSLNASKEANSVGFYWMAADGAAFTNGAHKAYLKLAKSSGIKGFAFEDMDSEDGIDNVNGNADANEIIYNLAGQRVNKALKGIYIINGKKVLK